MVELTALQYELLGSIADLDRPSGRAVQLATQAHSDRYDDLPTGTIYPALNDLVAQGVVVKTPADGKANEYSITENGKLLLSNRAATLTRGLPDHRLERAEPAQPPADAPRDENGDAVLDGGDE